MGADSPLIVCGSVGTVVVIVRMAEVMGGIVEDATPKLPQKQCLQLNPTIALQKCC